MMKTMFEIPSDETIKECRITKDSILGLAEPIVVRSTDGARETKSVKENVGDLKNA